ncbi:MAG: protein phosphatase 2C domain-containing protein [Candidatus Promineifilaceae bacterium]|nr:protein phosphatase 2C domain-containing protein [Candidatus Promineifilaceae bacterium]
MTESSESTEMEESPDDQHEENAGALSDGDAETQAVTGEDDGQAPGEEVPKNDDAPVSPEMEATYAADDPAQTAPLEPLPEHVKTETVSAPESGPASTPRTEPSIQVAQRTHVGAARQRNEDAVYTFVAQASGGFEPLPPFGLFVVADGMGGHYDGHKASKIVSRAVAQHVLKALYFPLLRGDERIARQPIQEVMEEAVERANQAIQRPEPDKEMGTTLTAVLILGNRLFLVHVGDSRAYLFSEDRLGPVTTDHSIVQALQDAGQLTAEQAAEHPNRNLLYRALIGEELEQVDTFTQALPGSGLILMCSDGLWGLVSESEMAEILSQELSLQEKVDRLVDKALEAGGHDNITVILVDFDL